MKIIIIILLLIILMCVISLFFYIRNQPQIVSYQPQPQPQPQPEKPQQPTIKIITQPQVPMYNRYLPPPAPYPDLAGNYYYHGNPYIKPKRRWWNWY